VLRYDSAGLNALVKIEWEWPFDSETTPGEYDSSDGAAAVAQATVAVNFGTVRYEQVDNTVPKAGDDYIFAGTDWRVSKVEGNKALIIKSAALTGVESGINDSTNAVEIPFLSATAVSKSGSGSELGLDAGSTDGYRGYYFFDRDGSNGYEDSGAAIYSGDSDPKYKYGLKGAIDYYYNHTLKAYENSILAVDLHNPTLEKFNQGDLFVDWTYSSGDWTSWYCDTRFATTYSVGGTKQAFALSYGDINKTMGATGKTSSLLGFVSYFWLRSAGPSYNAGVVYGGVFSYLSGVDKSLPVRPALWISLS
jgi:hypothetical protein